MSLQSLEARFALHAIFNAYSEPLTFALPPVPPGGEPWRRCLDTALDAPDDIRPFDDAPPFRAAGYTAEARSVVVLMRALGN